MGRNMHFRVYTRMGMEGLFLCPGESIGNLQERIVGGEERLNEIHQGDQISIRQVHSRR